MRIRADSYADADGVLTPQRLYFDERHIEIIELCDRWDGPTYRYFKVIGEDGNLYIVRYDEPRGEWDLTLFERRQRREVARPAEIKS
jgi:hypothetical protein